jgi:hypothetical protein
MRNEAYSLRDGVLHGIARGCWCERPTGASDLELPYHPKQPLDVSRPTWRPSEIVLDCFERPVGFASFAASPNNALEGTGRI